MIPERLSAVRTEIIPNRCSSLGSETTAIPCDTHRKLPAEIREIIHQHVLIASPSQSPITLRRNKAQYVNTDSTEDVKATESLTSPKTPKRPSPLPSCRFQSSNIAMLQTCRQVNQDAYYVFYASNSIRLISVKELQDFLISLGPARRNMLRSLCIGNVLTLEPPFWKVFLMDYVPTGRSTWRNALGSRTRSILI